MVEINYDANEYEPLGSFEPLPVGEYTVIIESSEKKPASTGKGEYLQLVMSVVEGEFHGRKLFERLNIVNESEQAQTIARRALSSLCRAVGVMTPKNSEELHNIPFVVKVGIRPAKGEYGPSNKITEYKTSDGEPVQQAAEQKPAKPQDQKPAAAAGAAAPKKKMPWAGKK